MADTLPQLVALELFVSALNTPDLRTIVSHDEADISTLSIDFVLQISVLNGGTRSGCLAARTSSSAKSLPRWWTDSRPAARLIDGESFLRLLGMLTADTLKRLIELTPFVETPEVLGQLYESFLTVSAIQLDAASVRAKNGRWLSPRALLRLPPDERADAVRLECGLPPSQSARLSSLGDAADEDALSAQLEALKLLTQSRGEAGDWVVTATSARRRSGSHYTPEALVTLAVEQTLAPLLGPEPSAASLLELRICDPAMGSGAFLLGAARWLVKQLRTAWIREQGEAQDLARAEQSIVASCLFGADRNTHAVRVARAALGWVGHVSEDSLNQRLRAGDSLLGPGLSDSEEGDSEPKLIDWGRDYPDIRALDQAGFDAILGNPPWVAYVGRATQPLERATARRYEKLSPGFSKYKTLHGLFCYRAVTLLRAGGRLGFVLPTSVADLAGYAPTRRAHDTLAVVDPELPDIGDGAFDDVFQPCMILLSTRRQQSLGWDATPTVSWTLSRNDIDEPARALLSRIHALPKLPPELFGERGFQTDSSLSTALRRLPQAAPPHTRAIVEGTDVGEFRCGPDRVFADPDALKKKLRKPSDWAEVALYVRQTARYPIACTARGVPFRNSVIAVFPHADISSMALLAFLNSSLCRWYHYQQHRDARQGMPQLKVGHLRSQPSIPPSAHAALAEFGQRLSDKNQGMTPADRAELNRQIYEAFELSATEQALIDSWSSNNPLPKARSKPPSDDTLRRTPG